MYLLCLFLFALCGLPVWFVLHQPNVEETFASTVVTWIGIRSRLAENPAPVIGDVNGMPTASDEISFRIAATSSELEFKLWEDDFSGNWRSRWDTEYVAIQQASTFQHEGETWLRVVYPEGEYGHGFHMVTNTPPQDRAYLEYKFRFGDDFEWVKGGKLPGLWGGTSGGGVPDGTDRFLVRFMWRVDGKGSAYVYHPDQPGTYGEDFRLDNFWFQQGVEQTLGLEVVLNTPGQHDGIIRAWLDGVLVVEETAMRFRDIPDLHIDGVKFDTFFGGNTDAWSPVKDETIEFGDFKVYTTPPWEGGQPVPDPVTIDLFSNATDQDASTFAIANIDHPDSGTVINNGDGTVTYQPNENFYLYDSFSYTVSDGKGGETSAQVHIWDDRLNPISGTSMGDTLNGTSGGDYITGDGGNDSLLGYGGNDVLYGGDGNDSLNGGNGNDVLIGGHGADIIDVSQGIDLVVYESVLDGGDTINGFDAAGADRDAISLDALFDSLGVDTTDRAGRISVDQNGNTHTVRVDTNGDGSFDMPITVNVTDGTYLNIGQDINVDKVDLIYGTLG